MTGEALYGQLRMAEVELHVDGCDAVRGFVGLGSAAAARYPGLEESESLTVLLLVERVVIVQTYVTRKGTSLEVASAQQTLELSCERTNIWVSAVGDALDEVPGHLRLFRNQMLGAWQRRVVAVLTAQAVARGTTKAGPCSNCGLRAPQNQRCSGCRRVSCKCSRCAPCILPCWHATRYEPPTVPVFPLILVGCANQIAPPPASVSIGSSSTR